MRINVLNPVELFDQHLIAEIREIKMLPKMLCRSLRSKNGVDFNKLPKDYTLNQGHGKFFYDKLKFIEKRFELLLLEADRRGFNLQPSTRKLYDVNYDYSVLSDLDVHNDYLVSDEAIIINRERIALRFSERPNFYRRSA